MLAAAFVHGKKHDHTQPRTVLAQVRTAARERQLLTGYISRLSPQGAWVRLDTLTGFVPASEVDVRYRHRVRTDLSTMLRPGQQVKVVVLQVSENGKHIRLSMRQAHAA